ncbi:MAG: oligosaccharide flippase family protein [Lachnospiraceae bacterium]|nr:oligosaccharide flippase family protein [Lachnospiraceae bacterium]
MADNSEKAVRSGIWYVISNVMLRAVGIITAPVYSMLLSTSEAGYANGFNNYVSLFTVVTCLCLIYSVGRAKIDYPDEFDGYMSAIQTLSSLFGLIVLGLVMLFMPKEGMLTYDRFVIFLLFAYLVIYPSIDYMQYKYRFEYRYRENIAISVIITVSTVILSVALILNMPETKGLAKILGTVIPSALVGLWCYANILRKGRILFRKEYWSYALKIGLPMIPHGLAMIALARIDTSMIQNICTNAEVGLYTSGYTIGTLLMFITNAIGQAWLPWFNERLSEGDREAIREKNMLLMKGGCFLTLAFIAAAPEAVKLLYPNKTYWDCMWVVPPVALGTLCQYFYTNYVNQELFEKKTALIAGNSIVAALANLGLNAIFIPRYGYIVAAYTTLAGYLLLMLLHYLSTRLILKQSLYQNGKYFLMVLLTILAGLAFTLAYNRFLIRLGMGLLVLGFLVFLWKHDIMKLVFWLKNRHQRQA